MTTSNQTDSTNPTNHKRQRKTKESATRAAQSGQQVGLAQRSAEVIGSEAVDEWAVPEALLYGPRGVFGDGCVESQMARLDDPRLSTVQRRALATEVGRVQGNRHLQRVMATLKQGERSQSTSANPGNGSANRVAQQSRAAETNQTTASEIAAPETMETLEELGINDAPVMVTPPTLPDDAQSNGLQRRQAAPAENAEAEAEPSEAEKAEALAAAAAAEQAATQSLTEGQAEVSKSKAEQATEREAGQAAKQKAAEAKAGGESTPKATGAAKQKEEAAKDEATKPDKAVTEADQAKAGGSEQTQPGVNGAGQGPAKAAAAGRNGAGPETKAPTSPEADPAFQAAIGTIKRVGAKEKAHAPATAKADEAQAAAESPASELEGKAQANQVGEMEQAETPAFDAVGFKAQLMERIQSLAPTTAKEADEFKASDKLGSVKGEMQGQVAGEQAASQTPLEEKTAAAPDSGSVAPKPVTPLAPPEPGAEPPPVGAERATPKPKGQREVEAPLQENSQELDQQMAEANITEAQLANSNEPAFQSALEAKKEAKTDAQQAPTAYREFEQGQINQAEEEAVGTAQERLHQGMHGDRGQLLAQIAGQQGQTKAEDEKARAKVAADIQKIYSRTKTSVETTLSELDGKVEKTFDAGAAAAKQAFENFVDAKMDAYKERRYGGWLGWAKWAKDKLLGMPSEVNTFYQQGRQLYLKKMDAVIDNVVAIIQSGLTQAKADVAQGKQEIQDYVNKLPEELQTVGQQAAQDMQSKFDTLEQSVDDKQNELIDTLANKYQENLQAVDARIEEMKAANRGLVDKALDAIGGVIGTILELKNMLLSVLASAADVIGSIIKDPIGFLGNLISGVKQGLQNFVSNISTHLKKGLMSWLFGAVAEAGVQLPESFDLKGILSLAAQILGATWQNIRARAVKLLGEEVVGYLETAFEIFTIIKEQGLAGLWEYIKGILGDLKTMVIDAVKDMVITQVIQAGIQWLMGILGGPAGAFIKAAKAIYDIIMWFVNNGSRVMSLVQSIIKSVSAIAKGAVGEAAQFIEESLAQAIPTVISFLASLLGLGGISNKIKAIIKKVQGPVNKAIDWVLGKAKKVAKKVMGKLKRRKKKEEGPDERTPQEKKADLNKALTESEQVLAEENVTPDVVKAKLPAIQSRYRLKSLTLVQEDGMRYHIEGEVNPQDKSKSYTMFDVAPFELHTGKSVPAAKRGSTYIALGKIEIYAMGKVAKYPEDELRQLQWRKQHQRKEFDEDPANEQRLVRLKGLKHNYERSQEMYESISRVGFVNSVEDVEKIIDHLLDVGEEVTIETDNKPVSTLEAPNGRLKVFSTWKVLDDGRKYLATINFIPQGVE